ncbi:hypothetical protein MHTCC0001_37550 [Flavobacteriaceae bacterium MHTCC 0001]
MFCFFVKQRWRINEKIREQTKIKMNEKVLNVKKRPKNNNTSTIPITELLGVLGLGLA